jgi:hypothetical protein
VREVEIQWRREFATERGTRIRDRFEASGTAHDAQKQRSERSCTATSPFSSAVVLEQCTRSLQTSAQQFARDTGITRSSIQRVLKRAKWKVYIPRLFVTYHE